MAGEYSVFEKNHPRNMSSKSGACLGRVTKVYADERMIEVKTFHGPDHLKDHHIPKAQWLSTDGHPDGDESGFVPKVNSYCMVHFVGGQPFVWGFISPLSEKGTTVEEGKEKEDLYEGDRVFKTTAGNKVILRSHGEIQIESTPTCRTVYFPVNHIINTLCRNYEFETDGGTINWVNLDPDLGFTYSRQEFRDDVDRTNIGVVEYGTMADDTDFFYRKVIGAGDVDGAIKDRTWTMTTLPDGETELFIRVPNAEDGFFVNIKPDGNTYLNVAGKLQFEIKPTGETTLDINKKHHFNIKPDGTTDLNINDKVKLKMTAAGVTTLDSSGGKFKFANDKIGMGSSSIELLAKISKELSNISQFCASAVNHVHIGNLGYQSSTPVDPSPWNMLKSSTESIKKDIDTISGGV